MKAAIMAFDRGEKIEPFSSTRPRCLIPVLNVPVLERLIAGLRAAQIEEILVLVGYMNESIERHFGDGSRFETVIRYIAINAPEGICGHLARLVREERDPILVVDGSLFLETGLITEFVRQLEGRTHCAGAVALATSTNPLYHLKADVAGDGHLKALREVTIADIKIEQQSPLDNMPAGMAMLSTDVASALERASRARMTCADLIRLCLDSGIRLDAVRTDYRFVALEYPWEILAASFLGLDLRFGSRRPHVEVAASANIAENVTMKGSIVIRDGVTVESGAVLKDVEIDQDSVIREHSYIQESVIGKRCTIGPTGYVVRSVLGPHAGVGFPGEFPWAVSFGHARFGHHCHAGMSVYGERSGLNAGAIATANREDAVKVKIGGKLIDSGWKNIGVFVGDDTRINAGAIIMPGRKLGPRSVIGPGVIVYRDVAPNTRIVLRQQVEEEAVDPGCGGP